MRCPACAAEVAPDARSCPACGAAKPAPAVATAPMPVPAGLAPRPASAGDAEARFVPGSVLAGRFRVVALLGRGGMGEVYRAEDLRLGQAVALKFLPESLAHDTASLARFYAEVRLGRGVSHPNVCRMYDLVEFEGHRCLSMEYVDGEDLSTLLARIGRLPADKAADVAREVCAGLAAAHEAGVIHRDLKPANVMIDGRGKARITDFGIATPSAAAASAELAGTPAWMAPELLRGEPASVQSDLYAFGLLLYEVCTGRPGAEVREWALRGGETGGTLDSLRALSGPLRDAIERCLAEDPAHRPASARTLLALLPGGDPLAAALAAGETPSPALVAAASRIGDLPLAPAWALLAACVLGIALIAWLTPSLSIVGRLQPDKPPEVLAERARSLLAEFGHDAPAGDWIGAYRWDHEVQPWWNRHPPSADRMLDRPGPVAFHYRQSTRSLVATRAAQVTVLPSQIGLVTLDDPPLTTPGVLTLTLDRQGELTRLVAPPESPAEAGARFDWDLALRAAGFDPAALAPARPNSVAPVAYDERLAWTGGYPGQAGPALRIEAAAYAGRPVWFEVQGPWTAPPGSSQAPNPYETHALWLAIVFCLALAGPMLMLMRRHLRLGRADRRGAVRMGLITASLVGCALMLRADHVSRVLQEYSLVVNILSQASYFGLSMWFTYLVVEPYARRRSPGLMIGWTRLLAGRPRDPLVGREILVGATVGAGLGLLVTASVALPQAWTGSNGLPNWQALSALGSLRHLGYYMLLNVQLAMMCALGSLFGYQLLATLTGRGWIAMPVQFLFTNGFFATAIGDAGLPVALLYAAIWLLLLMRVGVLAAIACEIVGSLLRVLPPLLDLDSWHGSTTAFAYLLLLAGIAWAFHVSLGGKPLLGARLAE